MKKILVLGYFGYINDQLDGQTVKTRSIYNLLKDKQNEVNASIFHFDTQSFKLSKLNIFNMFLSILKSKKVFYLGAHNNLKFIFPFIFLLCFVLRKEIHYVVIGGWLVNFLKNKPLHKFFLKKIKLIYPENDLMCQQLRNLYNFNNIKQLHNFRVIKSDDFLNYNPSPDNIIRLVFMARINKMKGIDVIFKIAKKIKDFNILNVVIDIYGPIVNGYEKQFYYQLSEVNDIVQYKGILSPEKIYKTLVKYDCMLFPTRYYTEGFPGSILDSYISGVPVVVSRWKYAEEFVENKVSGLICEFNNDDDFVCKVLELLSDRKAMLNLRVGTKTQAAKYSSEAAWNILKVSI